MSALLDNLVGVSLAGIAALSVAFTSLGIRIGTDDGRTTDALVIVLLCNLTILIPITVVRHYPEYGLTPLSIVAFVGAGLTGTLLGRVFYFTSISKVGSSRTEPLKATQPLHATLIAIVVLRETVGLVHLGGIILIIIGVGGITWEISRDNPQNLSTSETIRGVLLGLSAALFFGIEPIWAKIGLTNQSPVLVGLTIRTVTASVGFFAYLWLRRALPTTSRLTTANTRWYIAAGIANTIFLIAYYRALQVAPVSVVVPLIQTSPLVVIILSVLLLPVRLERITWKLTAGAGIIVGGAVVVTLYS